MQRATERGRTFQADLAAHAGAVLSVIANGGGKAILAKTMIVSEIKIGESYEIVADRLGTLTLSARLNLDEDAARERRTGRVDYGVPVFCDLTFAAFGKSRMFQDFAEPVRYEGRPPNRFATAAAVSYALGDESIPYIAVAGVGTVVIANFKKMRIAEALPLNRMPKIEDNSFYHMRMIPWRDGLVVAYESGVALLMSDGKRMWHRTHSWPDQLVRHDERTLYYRGEDTEGYYDFTISIGDGSVHGRRGPRLSLV